MMRIVVVGGGISGLSLAFRLEQALPSANVTLLERAERLGGTIATATTQGFRVELGPNGFLDNKPATVDLSREIGLGDRLLAASESAGRNRFLFLRGNMRQLPAGPLSFLFSNVVGWRSKFAVLTERFRAARRDGVDESIEDFARRRGSNEIAETLVDAFVTGIHAGDPGLLSVKAAFPRLYAFEQEHGSVSKGLAHAAKIRRQTNPTAGRQQMWSFADGLQLLVETLRQRLRTAPSTGVEVTKVLRDNDAWKVHGRGSEVWPADVVVLACPAHQQVAILADLDEPLAQEVGGIAYNAVAVVALGYRRAEIAHPLDGFGYLTPGRERRDVLGVQWCSSIFPGRAPDGMVLLRAMCGGWHRPEMVDWPEEQLVRAVRQELAVTLGIQALPVMHHIQRWPRAIPQYHLGHLDRLERIQGRLARHRGLFLTGNSYRGVAMNDCVEQAEIVTKQVKMQLGG